MGFTEDGECELSNWINSGYIDSDSVKYIFANLSDIAYKPAHQRQRALANADLRTEYMVMLNYTTVDVTSFWDYDCSKIIIAFRGTDKENYKDILADFGIAFGKLKQTGRYMDSESLLRRVISLYGKDNIILTGHSLGGAIASQLSSDYQIPAITFNTGSSPLDTQSHPFKTEFTTNDPLKGVIDPLSVSSYVFNDGKNIIVEQKEGENVHTISNFT